MNKLLLNNVPDRKCLMEASERFPEMDPVTTEVYLHFLKVSMDVVSEISEYLGEYGISSGRMSILMQLMKEPGKATPPGELADLCGVTPATISGLVDGLIKAELVERVVDPDDRRVQPVRLTESGLKHMEKLLPGYFTLIKRLFGVLDGEERDSLLEILKKLESNLENKENNDET
jgi:DNA-binding MarR family transcriptional regulator